VFVYCCDLQDLHHRRCCFDAEIYIVLYGRTD